MATAALSNMTSSTATYGASHQKMKYTFDQEFTMTDKANANTRKHRRHSRVRKYSEDSDPTDGSGSLTYSAASSTNSAGESTDSSFADIMKVLDLQEPQDLGAKMREKGMAPAEYQMYLQQSQQGSTHPNNKQRSTQASIASSLQYSTDGESNLYGTDLVSAITGQPSDSMAYDGGNYGRSTDQDILFAPAEPTDSIKKRKKEKRIRNKDSPSVKSKSSDSKSKSSGSRRKSQSRENPLTPSKGTRRSPNKNNNTPPPIPKARIQEDVCYAEWWMSCFPDAFKEMMPRR